MRIAVIYSLDDEHCSFSRTVRAPIRVNKSNELVKETYVLDFFLLIYSAISMCRA